MVTHNTAAATHASLALTVALMKHLAERGVIKSEDGATILNSAIASVKGLADEAAISAVIRQLTVR